jgi:hypothetical protein
VEKVTERLAADAPNMKRPGADLIKYYLDPDRLPVDKRWSRKHAHTQRRLCERFAAPVIDAITCQDIKTSHMHKIVNAASTPGEGPRVNHSLPVFVLLVNIDTMTVYWQEITEQQLRTGPRGGMYVEIPQANVLATARSRWEAAAEKFASTAAEDYEDNLERLAPSTAAILWGLAETRPGDAALLCAHLARGRHAAELTRRTLLVSAPPWLADLGADGYTALADFAHSHEADDLASEVFLAGPTDSLPESSRSPSAPAFSC